MRKLAVLAASALLGGLVGSPSAMAGDDDFSLTGRFTDFDKEDNGDRGWSKGDKVDFAFDLFDGRDEAGDGDGTCVITELDRDEREFAADCDVNFNLDDGDLDMEGEVTDEDFRKGEIVLDVVDGTDGYEDADGTATFSGAHGRRGGKGHHQMAAAAGDPASMDTALMSAMLPMRGGGHGDGDKDGRGDKKDGRGHRGGDRHFKADVDLD